MRSVNVREMRELLPDIEGELAREREILLIKRGRAVARITPVGKGRCERPDHAALRASIPPLDVASEVVVREERDARG